MKGREMYVLFAVTDLFWGYVNPPRGKSLCAPLSFLHILSLQAVSDAPITSTTFERLSDESCTVSSDNEQQPMRIRKEAIVSMIFQLIRNHLVVRNSQKEKTGVEIEQRFSQPILPPHVSLKSLSRFFLHQIATTASCS